MPLMGLFEFFEKIPTGGEGVTLMDKDFKYPKFRKKIEMVHFDPKTGNVEGKILTR